MKFNEKTKQLNLNEDREIYLDKNYQILIIEILPDIDNINKFLEVDLDVNLEEDENAYVLQYFDGKAFISYGIMRYLEYPKHKIRHYCSTEKGSSGSPILNLKKNKVIGVHIGCNSSKNFNYGTSLKYPIIDFVNKYKNKYNDKDFRNLYLLSVGYNGDIYSAFSIKDKIEVCLKKINLIIVRKI